MPNRNIIIGIFWVVFLVFSGCDQKASVSYSLSNSTDENWVNGIARGWATAFFVPDSMQAKSDFTVGKKVIFSDGTIRTIVQQKENAGGLIIYLDGSPLDGNIVGYPKKVKIIAVDK